jgi:NAD(P)-dependent dehydrogenase (short-subunit alcohol dehydrogenase family)
MTSVNVADAHVIVTGGSSGIGRAFVRRAVGLGARVSVIALPDDDLSDTDRELREQGATFAAEAADVGHCDRQGGVDRVGVARPRLAMGIDGPLA